MDVWQLIGRDHANIEHLIHEAPRALNGPGVVRSRETLLGELIDELESHASAIEYSLYGALAQRPETSQLAAELYAGHREFMRQLNRLTRYRRKGSEGWLDTFEDVTFLVDQHLHRIKRELLPAAQKALSADEVRDAARIFIRAKTRAIQGRRPTRFGELVSSEMGLGLIVGTAVAGLGYLLWQGGYLGRSGSRSRPGSRLASNVGQRGINPATASMPAGRGTSSTGKDRQEQLLDDGLEETFPASDPVSAQRFT